MSSLPTSTLPASSSSGGAAAAGLAAGRDPPSRSAAAAKAAGAKAKAGAKAAAGCMSEQCAGFRDFIMRGNVIDLAVAIVVGAAFTELIKAFVSSFITPLISAIWGGASFESLYFTVHGSQFTYGKFINALLSFLIICFIVYFCVVNPMIKLMGYLDPKSAKRSCPECLSEVAAGARKCMFCCSAIPIGAIFQVQMAEDVELKKDLADVRANKV